MMKKVAVVFALVVVAVWLIGTSVESYTCRFERHERFVVTANGKTVGDGASGNYGWAFPSLKWPEKFKDAGFDVRYLDQYNYCDDRYVNPITVVRFRVSDGFTFVASTTNHEVDQSLFEYVSVLTRTPVNEYVPWRVELQPTEHTIAWIPLNKFEQSMKTTVEKFDIEWIKEESLGQEALVGMWYGGWLFRSKTPGQYIWVL